MIRVGIAGLGFMGMVHYLTYDKLSRIDVVAICEHDKKRRAGDWTSIKGNFGPPGQKMDLGGISTYSKLEDLISDPSIDLIDITLPPSLHAEVAIDAMKAGKNVFSEKPMSLSESDCRQMVRVSEKTEQKLFVGHVLPFFPEYAWALKAVKSGKYGELLGGSFKRVISDPTWLNHYWSEQHVGGPMLDLHVHDAHFIRLLFGMPSAVRTQGRLRGELAEYWNSHFCFDNHSYVVDATSGVIRQQGRAFNHAFEIHLEKATLVFDFAVIGGEAKYLCPPTVLRNNGRAQGAKLSSGDPMDAFVSELGEVSRCIRNDSESLVLSSELAHDAVVLCHKQTQSLKKNQKVKI